MPFASIPEALENFAPAGCSSSWTMRIARTGATSPWPPESSLRRRSTSWPRTAGASSVWPSHPRAATLCICRSISAEEHFAFRHRVLRIDRRGRGRDYGNLVGRSRGDHPGRYAPDRPHDLARPVHFFRSAPGKAAYWFAPGKPKRPWIWRACAGRFSGGRDLRNHESRRLHGARPAVDRILKRQGLKMISVATLIRYRLENEQPVERRRRLPPN